MTIDELRSAAAIVRDATEEGENTATRIGQLFLDVVNTLCDVATNTIKGYVVISSTSELPTSPTADQQMLGYLLGTTLYVWVGTGGDTLDGKYQSAQLKGETGATGPAGADGHDGVDLGEVVLVNDLTTGGKGNALSAEMGKALNEDGYYFLPQKIDNGNFTSTSGWTNSQYCTVSASDGVLTLTPNSSTTQTTLRRTSVSQVEGHLYFFTCKFKSTKDTSLTVRFGSEHYDNLEANADWKKVSCIVTTASTSSSGQLYVYFTQMKSVSGETNYAQVKELTMVDLTAVFGEGNEPTLEQCNLLIGNTWAEKYKVTTKAVYDAMQVRKLGEIDLDVLMPLTEGRYAPQTAIEALPTGYNVKGFALKFVDEDGNHVKMTYQSSSIIEVDKNAINNWSIESDGEYAGVCGGSITFPTTDGYYLPRDTGDVVGGNDWYFEIFAELAASVSRNTAFISIARTSGGDALLMRYLASLQGYAQSGTASVYMFDIYGSMMQNGPHHLYVAKKGTTITTYIDGTQIQQVTDYSFATNLSYIRGFSNLSYWKLYMMRIGTGASDMEAQMLEHWNNGDVLGYKCMETDMTIEINRFGKTYAVDNVRNVALPLNNGVFVDARAYEEEISASGAPAEHPQYIGQRYYDTTNKRYYRAIGFTNVSDWKAFAYKDEVDAKQNALVSGVTIKTINGTSILGAGNIDAGGGGGGGGSTNVVNVTDYGATGTGVTDDTAAIMQALEVARVSRLPLYFPANGGNCTYLTRKGLVLTTGMKVTADKGAILKNASAVLNDVNGNAGTGVCAVTTLTANAAQGAHSVVVTSTAGLAVGQEVTIINSNLPSYQETLADITANNGNTVTIDTSRFTASGEDEGVLYALTSGAYLTTDFSLIKTCIGKPAVDIEIENITLQACGNTAEPYIYTISPINQTKQSGTPDNAQKRIYIRDVTIDGSVQDGISTQGQSDVWIEDCIIKDIKYKGIHYGTSCDRVIIRGNYIYNCGVNVSSDGSLNGGAGAIYFCVNNHRVLIEGNHIENCRRGVFGFDFRGNGETDTDSIVRGNTFTNCHVYGVALKGGYRMIVEGNIFRSFTGASIPIFVESEGGGLLASVISNNVIGGFASGYTNTAGAIAINGAKQLVVSGNVVQSLSGATGSFDVIVKTSQKVALIGNVVAGSVDISDVENSGCVKDNNIEN